MSRTYRHSIAISAVCFCVMNFSPSAAPAQTEDDARQALRQLLERPRVPLAAQTVALEAAGDKQ